MDSGAPEMLRYSMPRFFKFLPKEQRQGFLKALARRHHETAAGPVCPRMRL
jgi:hypothetical protein